MLVVPMKPFADTSVEPSALAVWQTLPHPLAMATGALAPGAIFMMPTDAAPPKICEPYVS